MRKAIDRQEADQILQDLADLAEPAFKEFKTTAYIKNKLKEFGITNFIEGDTGGFGTLDFGADTTIAIRADIDALPVNSEKTKFEHRCGHHLHTAGLLIALCNVMASDIKPNVNIRYLFQPAEETVQGAFHLMEKNVLKGVDEIYGLHVDPDLEMGTMSIKQGYLMAGANHLIINFNGNATHAAYPHMGTDVIMAAADFIQQIQTIVARKIDPSKMRLISFGKIEGGSIGNILPATLQLEGTMRYFDSDVYQIMTNAMENLLCHMENFHNVKTELHIQKGPTPLINTPRMTEHLKRQLQNSSVQLAEDHRISMGGEDFACYLENVPGAFIRLGIKTEALTVPLHSENFAVQPEALTHAVDIWNTLIYSY